MKYAPKKRHIKMQKEINEDLKRQNILRFYFKQLTGMFVLRGDIRGKCVMSYHKYMKRFITTP